MPDPSEQTVPKPNNGHEFGLVLRAAYFALRRCCNTQFEKLDANGDQFLILKLLADHGPLNQLELVRRGGYDPSTATNILKSLERQGYVSRVTDPDDGRAKIVELTNAGRERQAELWKASASARRRLWKCVRAEDRQIVAETLGRIVS